MPRKHIKSLILTLVLIMGLFASVRAVQLGYQQFIKAEEVSIPQNVRITNLSDNSASLSWITDKEITGFIVWGTAPGSLAQSQKSESKSRIHHFNLRSLKPSTLYYYKIGSGSKTYDNNGSPYIFTTAPIAPVPPTPDEVYGKVNGVIGPASGAVVYLTLKDQDGQGSNGSSTIISSLTSSSGSFATDLGNTRSADLSNYFSYSREEDYLEIEVEGADQGKARVILTTAQTQPLPRISLSETGTLVDLTLEAMTEEQKTSQETRTQSQGGFEELIQPVSEEEIQEAQEAAKPKINMPSGTTLKPGDLITGTASPGATLTLKIESTSPITDQIQVDNNGNWSYQIPSGLTSGSHIITIASAAGNDSQNFVLASAGAVTTTTPTQAPLPVTAFPLPTLVILISGGLLFFTSWLLIFI